MDVINGFLCIQYNQKKERPFEPPSFKPTENKRLFSRFGINLSRITISAQVFIPVGIQGSA